MHANIHAVFAIITSDRVISYTKRSKYIHIYIYNFFYTPRTIVLSGDGQGEAAFQNRNVRQIGRP